MKRQTLTLQSKLEVLSQVRAGKRKAEVAKAFNIPASTLSTILKNAGDIEMKAESGIAGSSKRVRKSTHEDVDEALLRWFKQARDQGLPITGPVLMEKAKALAAIMQTDDDFAVSTGWFERWKVRHNISFRNVCGEAAAVDVTVIQGWQTSVLPQLLQQYEPRNIYNADETGLFWRMLPDKTLHFKGMSCTGGKASKERLTVLLCANMDGSHKLKPFVIGRSKSPRCFRGIRHLPVSYKANLKAWMTSEFFEEWVRAFDRQMQTGNRDVLLLLDNCPAHPPKIEGLRRTQLAFLPPNTTSQLQPCDQGLILAFKRSYRTRLLRKYLVAMDVGMQCSIDLLDALELVKVSWMEVKETTIQSCWRKAGIWKAPEAPLDVEDEAFDPSEIGNIFQQLRSWLEIPNDVLPDTYVSADDDIGTSGLLTDRDIVSSLTKAPSSGPAESESDGDGEESTPEVVLPTVKDALEALKQVRVFLQCQEEDFSDQLML